MCPLFQVKRLEDIIDTYHNNGKRMLKSKSPQTDTSVLPQSSSEPVAASENLSEECVVIDN